MVEGTPRTSGGTSSVVSRNVGTSRTNDDVLVRGEGRKVVYGGKWRDPHVAGCALSGSPCAEVGTSEVRNSSAR